MKAAICYIIILLAAALAPVERVDVGQMQPVEVIYICKDADAVVLKTDTGDVGVGVDAETALTDMKQTSAGVIYLDTAQYLVIGPGAQEDAMALKSVLRGSVQLCLAEENMDLKQLAKYLPAHGELPGFAQWSKGENLLVLHKENDRIKLS